MSSRPYLIVSGDAHAGPSLEDDLRPYCPQNFLSEFDEFAAQHRAATEAGQRQWSNPSFAGAARVAGAELDTQQYMPEDVRKAGLKQVQRILENKGSFDPNARLADMDGDGVASELIFAGAQKRDALPWAGGNYGGTNPELQALGGHLWNQWLADFCSAAPERLLGVAQVPIWDIDAAIKEVYWAKEHGLRSINFPAPRPDYPAYNETDVYEPFWSAVEEVNLPLVCHSASGEAASGGRGQGAAVLFLSEVLWLSRRGLGQVIFGGVFDRHPSLMVVFVEQRGNWVKHTLDELDSAYLGVPRNSTLALLGAATEIPKRMPSEYWQTNCAIADSFMARYEAEMREEVGIDTFIWGTDYPHIEGTWPNTRLALRKTFAGIPEQDTRKILGDNAVRVFDLDIAKLQPIVDRIGPTPEDLSVPLGPDEKPDYPGLAFREAGSFH